MPRLLASIAIVCALFPLGGTAQIQQLPRYNVTLFDGRHGLPGNQIYSIDQSPDGYLWVATNNGLARFDGYAFEDLTPRIHPPLNSPLFIGLSAVTADSVAAVARGGSTDGSDILFVQGDSLVRHGSPDNSVMTLNKFTRDGAGRLWGVPASEGKLYRFDTPDGVPRRIPMDEGLSIFMFRVDRSGQAWMSAGKATARVPGVCANTGASSWMIYKLEESGPKPALPNTEEYIMYDAGSGSVVAMERQGRRLILRSMDGRVVANFDIPASSCPQVLTSDKALWVREGSRLVKYQENDSVVKDVLDLDLRTGSATPTFVDSEGTLWVGTYTQGLFRIRKNPVRVVTTTPIADDAVTLLAPGANGSVLLIDVKKRVFRAADALRPEVVESVPFLSGESIFERSRTERLVAERVPLPDGSVRISIFRRRQDETPRRVAAYSSQSRVGGYFKAVAGSLDNLLFWTSDDAVLLRDAFGDAPSFQILTGGKFGIRDVLLQPDGVLWAATESGLFRVDGTSETRFARDTGAPSSHFRSLHVDSRGTLWAGTYGQGLLRFDGHGFQAITEADGLFENAISAILEDDHGNLWMNGNKGIQRVALADLQAFFEGTAPTVSVTSFGAESGLVNPESTGSRAVEASNGTLWFPTFFGAAVVDPDEPLLTPPVARPPLIKAVMVDGVNILQRDGHARVRPDEQRFTVTYSGMSLRNPERQRYRYRLDGFDPDWVDAGEQREATYTNVPPGDYVFRLQRGSGAGDWSDDEAVAVLAVAPEFFETRWFWSFMVLTGGLLLFAAYRMRTQHLRAREVDLNRIVRERTNDLKREKEIVADQAAALRSLDEAKSRLFANISHEFRTPLTLILGPLEDLRAGMHGGLTEGAHRQIQAAVRNGQRLLTLINQLLDVSRMETDQFRLEARPVDLGWFTGHICAAFRVQAERNGHPFHVSVPEEAVMVYIDPEHFQKVLTNLLGNAFKFTPSGKAISVQVRSDASGAVLEVSDEGTGMEPADAARAFDRFYQADNSSTRRREGTGIGLALVKSLVDHHGGTVSLASSPGAGSTFTIRLPFGYAHLAPDEVLDEEDDAAPAFTLLPMVDDVIAEPEDALSLLQTPLAADADVNTTVLVVDDHADVRAYIRTHLAPRYRVLEASNGQEALDMVHEALPDLVISDVMMPDMDGFELCDAIKQDPDVDFIPVLLLTARASQDSRLEGLGTGADDYLTKPFDMRELLVRVENILVGRQRLKRHYTAAASEPRPRASDPDVERALGIIEERLSEDDFSVQALAEAVGMGRTTLFRRFKEALDQTPMDYLWERRLSRAHELLSTGSGTVSEVAYGVGFKSVAHFSTRFRDTYGVPPSAVQSEATQ